MPNRPHIYTAQAAAIPVPDDNPIAVVVLGGISSEYPNQVIKFNGWANFTPDVAATDVVLDIFKDAGLSQSIEFVQIALTAGAAGNVSIYAELPVGEVSAAQYWLAISFVSALGASTVHFAQLTARID